MTIGFPVPAPSFSSFQRVPPATTYVGLVANGDGLSITNDAECGGVRADLTIAFVQTGSAVAGIATLTVRVAPRCTEAVGLTDSTLVNATVTGSLAGGSGTISGTVDDRDGPGVLTGSFANGRLTGTILFVDGTNTTFAVNLR